MPHNLGGKPPLQESDVDHFLSLAGVLLSLLAKQ